jgi:hypothetical protein
MYAKNDLLTKEWVQIQIIFSDFEFKRLHKIKSKSPITQFPKITSIIPEVLINKAKP